MMTNSKIKVLLVLIVLGGLLTFSACDENNKFIPLFSIQDDKDLGKQVSDEIAADPATYPILDRAGYVDAYAYLDGMVNEILNNGDVTYRDEFVWDVHIIHDDEVLNAFATPGGYIYVYTGLIKYLDEADDLAGVLGHEIAHADLRHTSSNLQKQYGIQVLLSILLGQDAGQLTKIAGQVAGTVAGLSFSREFEAEADDRAVEYNAKTKYACDGVKNFFQKLEDEGAAGGTPEFLSTHPSPETRVADITAKATELGCDTSLSGDTGYETFKANLPE
ncbi:MAG: M48 family metalloprotease [Fulvivirga sp.]